MYRIFFEFSLPVQNFILAMVYGIIRSRSVIEQQIGIVLNRSTSLKDTCKNIYRNLKRKFLYIHLMLIHMKKAAQDIKEETPIIMDASDIHKQYATKMEGMSMG